MADIGSGGGILSEALGRLGGTVVGVDACVESVEAARAHLGKSIGVKDRVTYRCMPVEELAATEAGTFDVVVASEVVEHVASLPQFLASCVALVKPGGALVITTINKSPLAGALAIFAAEQVLGLVAPGTHEYSKLVGPQELGATLRSADPSLVIHPVQALWYDPLSGRWSAPSSWPPWALVNYALVATKPRPQPSHGPAPVHNDGTGSPGSSPTSPPT